MAFALTIRIKIPDRRLIYLQVIPGDQSLPDRVVNLRQPVFHRITDPVAHALAGQFYPEALGEGFFQSVKG